MNLRKKINEAILFGSNDFNLQNPFAKEIMKTGTY